MNGNRHVAGGGVMHRPKKKARARKSFCDLKADAFVRAVGKIREDRIEAIRSRWSDMNGVRYHGVPGTWCPWRLW